jgi:hypothetical protein
MSFKKLKYKTSAFDMDLGYNIRSQVKKHENKHRIK